MGKKDKKLNNKEKLTNLKKQQRDCEILYQRLQGAIELLEDMIGDDNEETN